MCCRPVIFDHKTSINSLLFDPAVTLFFPCDTLLSNVAKTHAEEDSTASINLSSCCVPSAVEGHHQSWKPKSWWFGQRNNYFVGVCCTGRTTVEIPSRGCKEGKFSVSKNGPTVNLVVSILVCPLLLRLLLMLVVVIIIVILRVLFMVVLML